MAWQSGPAPANGQRRLVIGLVVAVVILLVALAWVAGMLIGKNQGGRTTSSTASASTSSTPGSSPSPQASATGGAPSGLSRPAEISGAGSLLGPGPGADPAPGRGNGGSCQIWIDPGWTGDCGIAPLNGTSSSDQAVAYVTEHKPGQSGVQWRAFLMTTTGGEPYWHTKLYFSDEMGGGFTKITIKAVDTTGGGRPDLLVGFRHNKTSGSGTVLDYDVVQRNGVSDPLAIVMHRQLADGSIVVVGGHINDYESGAGPLYAKSDITFSGGLFHLASTSQVARSAVPASLLP